MEYDIYDRFSTKRNLEFLEKHLVVKPLDIVRIKCLECGDTHRVPKEIWNNAPHLYDSHMKLSYCPVCKKPVTHVIVEEVKSDERLDARSGLCDLLPEVQELQGAGDGRALQRVPDGVCAGGEQEAREV